MPVRVSVRSIAIGNELNDDQKEVVFLIYTTRNSRSVAKGANEQRVTEAVGSSHSTTAADPDSRHERKPTDTRRRFVVPQRARPLAAWGLDVEN
jgi:hypothetical protein